MCTRCETWTRGNDCSTAVGTRITYQTTGDAGYNMKKNSEKKRAIHQSRQVTRVKRRKKLLQLVACPSLPTLYVTSWRVGRAKLEGEVWGEPLAVGVGVIQGVIFCRLLLSQEGKRKENSFKTQHQNWPQERGNWDQNSKIENRIGNGDQN